MPIKGIPSSLSDAEQKLMMGFSSRLTVLRLFDWVVVPLHDVRWGTSWSTTGLGSHSSMALVRSGSQGQAETTGHTLAGLSGSDPHVVSSSLGTPSPSASRSHTSPKRSPSRSDWSAFAVFGQLSQTSPHPVAIRILLVGVLRVRAVVADIPHAVAINVGLISIRRAGAVVTHITHAITVRVRLVVIGHAGAVVAHVPHQVAVTVSLVSILRGWAVVADITYPITVTVGLVVIGHGRAVVAHVPHAIVVTVGLVVVGCLDAVVLRVGNQVTVAPRPMCEWIAGTLIARRDGVGRTYFDKMLPLDEFRVENGRLVFDDLSERYNVAERTRTYTARWLRLINAAGALVQLQVPESFQIPSVVTDAGLDQYHAVRIEAVGEDPERNVTVYLREGREVVGVERSWPGKVLADPSQEVDTGVSRFADLESDQQELYAPYARRDAEARGRTMTPAEHFDSQTLSERTTFEAVTHALLSSELTDAEGRSLGRAFDIIADVERVAGQYYGRGGDQQFRLYVDLKPDAVDTLQRSAQFFEGHENTVYHVGYPYSFRQEGDVPNMQVSVSDDGLKADIDVDYRSSKSPQALFNGHLTSANSDVRAGDNVDRHNGRWSGMIAWWRGIFGDLPGGQEGPQDLLGSASSAEVPVPLPPDRPRDAVIERPEDAIQEFLTDWLVRREIDEAMAFVSDRAYACVNIDDDARYETLDAGGARAALHETMRYSVQEMGELHNLAEAIDAVPPLRSNRQVISHAFEGEFIMAEMSPEDAAQYLCGGEQDEVSGSSYHGVLFRFKQQDGGALGLLWTREDGQWKLVSYQIFEL